MLTNKKFNSLLIAILIILTGFTLWHLHHPAPSGQPLALPQVSPKGKITLLPLDGRPPCRQFVISGGKIAGLEVSVPPSELQDYYSLPGNTQGMREWLSQDLEDSSAVIISIDQLLHGGLLAAREKNASHGEVDNLIGYLRELHEKNPQVPLYAFSILPRLTPQDSIDGYQERKDLVAYSRLVGKKAAGLEIDEAELRRLEKAIPPQSLAAYLAHFKENEYLNQKLVAYWRRDGLAFSAMLNAAEAELPQIAAECEAFDKKLLGDAEKVGGSDYAALCSIAYRQSIAAHKLVAATDGTPYFFSKENFSNGCICTVDVTYPSAPLYLLVQPALLKGMLIPILNYAELKRWPYNFAPHDLGTYPLANGQVYGGGEKNEVNQMPVEESGNMLILFAPLVGILLTVLFVRYIIKGDIGHGIPSVLLSISRYKGSLPPRNMYSSLVASTLTVAFGGSVGLEAPIASTGSAIGSNVGRFFHVSHRGVKLLLGCGAAGAIAGIFKAPLAGVLFTVEVLMFDMTMTTAVPLLVSALSASTVAYFLMGQQVQFVFTVAEDFSLSQIPFLVVLGIFCAFSSVYFLRCTDKIESLFGRSRSWVLKWLIGGVSLGVMIFLFPPLYGEGYWALTELLGGSGHDALFASSVFNVFRDNGWAALIILLMLILLKPVATAATIGSGGVGGTFGPSLIMGGLSGYFIAALGNQIGLPPQSTANFALVGMAAVMTGVMHGVPHCRNHWSVCPHGPPAHYCHRHLHLRPAL